MKLLKAFLIPILIMWQLPQCLLGAIIWLVCRIKKRQSKIYNGRILTEWGSFNGLSLGYFLFVSNADYEPTVKHEYGHTKQSQYLGWLYLLVIGLPSIIWAVCFERYRKKHGVSYYAFYTERGADRLGGIIRL